MDASVSTVRQTRAQHRHQLRTLTYVTFDQANGGVVRNLTYEGIGAQVVAAVRPRQQVRLRFELRYPRLRIETRGEVVWATFSGQCGIRFLDLSPKASRQIKEWIFGNLLEEISLHTQATENIFADASRPELVQSPASVGGKSLGKSGAGVEEDDGLLLSGAPVNVIQIPARPEYVKPAYTSASPPEDSSEEQGELDWLSQPLTGRSLAWTIHTLVVMAGMLLFTLVFLSVTGEAPRWPIAAAGGALILVAGLYWMFFRVFGGSSLGTRLSRLTGMNQEEDQEAKATRFR
jgi:hypothetical protein